MANYEGWARSNYFQVKNEVLFRGWADRRNLMVVTNQVGIDDPTPLYSILAEEDQGWPSEENYTKALVDVKIIREDQFVAYDQTLEVELPPLDDYSPENAAPHIQEAIEQLPAWSPGCTIVFNPDNIEFEDDTRDFSIADELYPMLEDGEVAILESIGREGMRYLDAFAIAINNKGESRRLSLSDIYDTAKELGPNVTQVAY